MRQRHAVVVAGAMIAAALGAGAIATSNSSSSSSCGVERWAVKTGTDAAARTVVLTPHPTTVVDLDAVYVPSSPTTRINGLEDQVYTVHATLTDYKLEADSDYHLAITEGGQTMIAEIPKPSCALKSLFTKQIISARKSFEATHHATAAYTTTLEKVTITGVAFVDKIHGQRGVAPNGIELHPVLSIQFGP